MNLSGKSKIGEGKARWTFTGKEETPISREPLPRSIKKVKGKSLNQVAFLYLSVVLLILAIVSYGPLEKEEAIPVFAKEEPLEVLQEEGFSFEVLKFFLQRTLPGLRSSGDSLKVEKSVFQFIEDMIYAVIQVRPSVPVTYLSSQISLLALMDLGVYASVASYSGLLPEYVEGPIPSKDSPLARPDTDIPPYLTSDEPLVLIYHTHTSEAYDYRGDNPHVEAFTQEVAANVLGAGKFLANVLQDEYGIGVIHVTDYFDIVDGEVNRLGAYYRSLQKIDGKESLLEQYPSVRIVVDLHRDGLPKELTTAVINGQSAAKISIVIGTGDSQLPQPNWETNYCFASQLTQELERKYPGVVRSIMTKPSRYNQHVLPGAILVEVGGYENSMNEVLLSTRMLADALASLIYNDRVPLEGQTYRYCP